MGEQKESDGQETRRDEAPRCFDLDASFLSMLPEKISRSGYDTRF